MNKVIFKLERNEDGFPPVGYELINATSVGSGLFKLENAPFFTPSISYNDVVKASPTATVGQYSFEAVVEQSRFCSLSIVVLDDGMDTFLMDLFRGLACVIEYGEFGVYRVLAVAIPETVDYQGVRERLQLLEDRDLISYAELAIPDRS